MDKIHIGLLLSSSTILPLGKDFEKGLNEAIKLQQDHNTLQIEITKAFIGQGGIKQTEETCTKFFTYDDVDIVTGVLSNKVIVEIAEKFNTRQIPLVANNLGCYLPASELNEHVSINSLNLWQHAWSIGHWGVKTFGKKGMFVSALYDAGYSFSQMFHLGMQSADAESEWSFSVPPMPANGELTDMSVIFPFLEKYTPDFIFAAFCGAETTLFINEFIKRGWHKKTKLIGLPFLLAPFKPVDDDITIYTTSPHNNEVDFVAENVFYNLGYQTGSMIAEAANLSDGTDLSYQIQQSKKRFSLADNNDSNATTSERVCFIKNDIAAHEKAIVRHVIESYPTYSINHPEIKTLTEELNFGWENPYLCI